MEAIPTLVAVAHGTEDHDGLAEIRRLINIVRTRRPELAIELCWLEGASPTLASLLPSLTGPVVIVPLLLSTGYHVKVDIPSIVAGRPATAVSRQLGPDPKISRVVYLRLAEARKAADEDGDGEVVLIGAGSSDPEARDDLKTAAKQLERWIRWPARVAVMSDPDPCYSDRDEQVANYLLAPGYFYDRLRAEAGAMLVGAPIGAHPLVAEVILERYDEGVSTLGSSGSGSSLMPNRP
jgi:sirohydrochlorin ferrochelatase